MSTFFPVGGDHGHVGHWWRMLHSALEAGADLGAVRLIHVAGMSAPSESVCASLEERLGHDAACMPYDPTALLMIEPGLSDVELVNALCDVLSVSPEQVRLWAAQAVHDDGIDFQPLGDIVDGAGGHPSETASVSASVNEVVLTDAEFSYIPIWDLQSSEIFAYVCEAVWGTDDGERVPEEALDGFFAKPRHVFALDREALHKAVVQAQDFMDRYVFSKMIIPVHYSTVADEGLRTGYYEAFNDGIWPVIDLVIFEITKIPPGFDNVLLHTVMDELNQYSQGVMLRVERDFDGFGAIRADVPFSVGLDFRYDARPDEEIDRELNRFAALCHGSGLRCHAHSLRNMENCIGASNAGYSFISSNAIASPIDTAAPEDEMTSSLSVLRAMLKSKT